MWLNIQLSDQQYFVAIVYARPKDNLNLQNITNKLTKDSEDLKPLGKTIILGDFNCRMGALTRDTKKENPRAQILTNFLHTTKSTIVKTKQKDLHWTFYRTHNDGKISKSVNDLVITEKQQNRHIKNYKVHNNISLGSDHRLITFDWCVQDTIPKNQKWTSDTQQKETIWNDENSKLLIQNLNKPLNEWQQKATKNKSNDRLTEDTIQFLNILSNNINTLPPKNNNIRKDKNLPNFKEIRTLIKKRDELLLSFNENNSTAETIAKQISLIQQTIKTQTKSLTLKSQRNTWNKILETRNNSTTQYWKMIKRLRKAKEITRPTLIQTGGTSSRNHKDILQAFANNYSKTMMGEDHDAKKYYDLMNYNKKDIEDHRKTLNKHYNDTLPHIRGAAPTNNPLFDDNITLDEVLKAIKATKKHTAAGNSGLTIDAINAAGKQLHKCIHLLFTKWWNSGIIPDQLQLAIIKPIYKNGNTNDPKNYRPISLLETLFKLYEKVLEKRLNAFIFNNNLLPNAQMGSRKHSGTIEAIYNLLSVITTTSHPTLGLLDLSKAYDRVWRTGLWTKLINIGVSGKLLRAIHSTYSNPQALVKIGDKKSNTYSMKEGLRQGSVLSPILFVLLFSDIAHKLDPSLTPNPSDPTSLPCQLFVDDTILITTSPTELLEQLDNFNREALLQGSVLNLDKTCILTKENLSKHHCELEIRGISSQQDNVARYLGIWVTLHNQTWNQHFNKVLSKARRTFYELRSLGLRPECLHPPEIIKLIKILLLPKLLYALEVITPSEPVIDKVNKFLYLVASKCLGIPGDSPPPSSLWEAGISDFRTLAEKQALRFHHKILLGHTWITDLYKPGNYLYDRNQALLTRWFPCSKHTVTKLTKHQWKHLLNKREKQIAFEEMSNKHPAITTLKPLLEIDSLILQMPLHHRKALLAARNAPLSRPEKCRCGKNTTNLHYHILTDCPIRHNVLHRTVMTTIIWNANRSLVTLTKPELAKIMLGMTGKIPTKTKTKIITMTAQLLNDNNNQL